MVILCVCVRLKVAEIAGLGVGRVGGGGRRAEQPWKPSCSACPTLSLTQLPGRGLAVRWSPWQGVRARSTGQEGPGALSVRSSTWQDGMLALPVLGRQWKRLPGIILGKPTKGLASQYSGGGPWPWGLETKGTWFAAGPLGDCKLLPDGSPQFCHLTSGDTNP